MITYRSNAAHTLHAAYCGAVRIGYVEKRAFQGWRWQLIFLQPNGGVYMGTENHEVDAMNVLEQNFQHWLDCARLRRIDDDPHATQKEKEDTDKTEARAPPAPAAHRRARNKGGRQAAEGDSR